MRFLSIVLLILLLSAQSILSQGLPDPEKEKAEVIKTVRLYAKSIRTGDVAGIENSVHYDINKVVCSISNSTGKNVFTYIPYSAIIENARNIDRDKTEKNPDVSVSLLQWEGAVANAGILTNTSKEYLQLVKDGAEWKIVRSLSWDRKTDAASAGAKQNIEKTMNNYVEGILGGYSGKLASSIVKEYCRIQPVVNQQTKNTSLNLLRYGGIINNSLNMTGNLDFPVRNYTLNILDNSGNIAVAELILPYNKEYLHLVRSGKDWKIFSSLRINFFQDSFMRNSPVYLEEEMPDFTLPVYGGGSFTLSRHKGKNILLVFPRGWIGTFWCSICQYQYLELAALEKKYHWREKYDLDIYFVLPYSQKRIENWFSNFKNSIDIINNWKNLQGFPTFVNFVNTYYPMKFELKENEIPEMTFPVLIDADRTVSKKFKLFTQFWDGVKAEQNISTIYLLDKQGTVQFKYFSQQTQDRPRFEYIMKFLKAIK